MTDEEWQKNKAWLTQLPGSICIPIIEQLERYIQELPHPPVEEKKDK